MARSSVFRALRGTTTLFQKLEVVGPLAEPFSIPDGRAANFRTFNLFFFIAGPAREMLLAPQHRDGTGQGAQALLAYSR